MLKKHISILVDEVCDAIPQWAKNIVDGTAGHGGHIRAMYEKVKVDTWQETTIRWIDKDGVMIDRLNTQKNEGNWPDSIYFLHTPYDAIGDIESIKWKIDYLLLDIGINWEHVVDAERWFSIKADGPLDMRFDTTQWKTARDYLMLVSPENLSCALQAYGDFPPIRAKKIADYIVHNRRKNGLATTNDFKKLLQDMWLGNRRCAIVYQVVRIVVNDELGHLERFLETFWDWLAPGGRCAIITFHSVEDRQVKKAFKELHKSSNFTLVSKKAIQPSRQEKEKNKASRSAKLRIIERNR